MFLKLPVNCFILVECLPPHPWGLVFLLHYPFLPHKTTQDLHHKYHARIFMLLVTLPIIKETFWGCNENIVFFKYLNYEPSSWTGLACKSVGQPTKKTKRLRFESAPRIEKLYFPTLQKIFKILLHQSNFLTVIVVCRYKFHTCT